jgi:hypothetical protein
MDPSYETVVEFQDVFWSMAVYLLHGAIVVLHTSLACFLLASGVQELLFPERDGAWLRRLGATAGPGSGSRALGGARIVLGLLLFAPLLLGAPVGVSLFAAVSALLLLVLAERRLSDARRPSGRFVRRAALACALLASLFMVWEREDNLALGADLLAHAGEWRNEELDWQLSLDPQSPKVGDLAPDFELQDPEGVTRVRLSDFRGKRPVALVFGSYT